MRRTACHRHAPQISSNATTLDAFPLNGFVMEMEIVPTEKMSSKAVPRGSVLRINSDAQLGSASQHSGFATAKWTVNQEKMKTNAKEQSLPLVIQHISNATTTNAFPEDGDAVRQLNSIESQITHSFSNFRFR